MNTNRTVRIRLSVKTIRELLGIQDNGYAKHVGLEPEDTHRRKVFTGHGQACEGFYHFYSSNTGRAKNVF